MGPGIADAARRLADVARTPAAASIGAVASAPARAARPPPRARRERRARVRRCRERCGRGRERVDHRLVAGLGLAQPLDAREPAATPAASSARPIAGAAPAARGELA